MADCGNRWKAVSSKPGAQKDIGTSGLGER